MSMLARMRMKMYMNLSWLHSANVEDFSNKGVLIMKCFGQICIGGLGVILRSMMVWIETGASR